MSASEQIEGLIASLERAVDSGLAYLVAHEADAGAGGSGWGPKEVLSHMVFWHRATVEGIESVASGGPPYKAEASADEINAREVPALARQTAAEIAAQVRQLQVRLSAAARAIEDPEAVVFIRDSGAEASTPARLELIASHWNEHVEELQG